VKISNGQRKPGNVFSKASRAVWCRLPWHQVSVNIPKIDKDDYDHICVALTRGNSTTVIDLSRLTLPELAAFRFAVLVATDLAEPIVRALDEKARNDYATGDDSDDRGYRGLPTLVVRRSVLPVGAHSEGVLQRYQDALQGIGGQVLSGGGPAEAGSDMAEAVDGYRVGSDDDSSTQGEHPGIEGIPGV